MKWRLIVFLFLLRFPTFIGTHYYLYPVASLHQNKIVLVIKQSSIDHIDLLVWNRQTKQVTSGLWSLFNPAGIQMLPDESGFSFIDNGRLRIKYFNKRSPKTIDFDQYLYDIHIVHWINSQECYLSAKSTNDYFNIFHCSINGDVACIASYDECDCNYPQKVGNELFYIQKTKDKKYYIVQNNAVRIISFDDIPIVFLTMESVQSGFVLSHDKMINSHDTRIKFDYYQIKKERGEWKKKRLFSFFVPSDLLTKGHDHCLYESLLPLIPRRKGSLIYYVDSFYNQENRLVLFSYDIKAAKRKKICIKKKVHKNFYHTFVPFVSDSGFVYGGSVL